MKNKIKVLHIIKTLNLGGAEVNLLNLLATFDKNRFECHVAYSFGGELESKFKELGAILFKYSAQDNKVKSLETFNIVRRLVGYIIKNKIDIIHTHNFSAHLWGCMAGKISGCKIVEHVHDFRYLDPEDFAKRRGFNNQYKFVKRLRNVSDRVIVLTKQNQDYLIDQKIYSPERIREFQNGIFLDEAPVQDLAIRTNCISKYHLPNSAAVILTPVRLAPEKNVDLILRIAPKVIKECPDACFLIAGDGPLYKEIELEIRRNNLQNNVKLIGYHPDIKHILRTTDVLLLPSFLELHSIAILEATSLAVPVVISSNVGCNSEFVQNWQNGVLLDPFKDEGWAEALIRLIKDKELAKEIGRAGYNVCCSQFDIYRTIKNIERLYAELCA